MFKCCVTYLLIRFWGWNEGTESGRLVGEKVCSLTWIWGSIGHQKRNLWRGIPMKHEGHPSRGSTYLETLKVFGPAEMSAWKGYSNFTKLHWDHACWRNVMVKKALTWSQNQQRDVGFISLMSSLSSCLPMGTAELDCESGLPNAAKVMSATNYSKTMVHGKAWFN